MHLQVCGYSSICITLMYRCGWCMDVGGFSFNNLLWGGGGGIFRKQMGLDRELLRSDFFFSSSGICVLTCSTGSD